VWYLKKGEGVYCGSLKTQKVISLFLLLVLCIQLTPLRKTISWLLSGQSTEELVHTGESDAYLPEYTVIAVVRPMASIERLHPAPAVELPRRHADDIPTPPPNC
jgi:hypothetical protein